MGESTVISIAAAAKRFQAPEGGFVHALRSVSLDVGSNEFITLLGPSGCGKTTLLRAVSGFENLDAGTITIDSQLMTHVPPHRRPVNTVFQNYALFPHLTVGDNIGYGLDVTGCARDERNHRVGETLELVGLTGFERRKPGQLSGGQQQRVALARAIINRPKVLLLDEPLSALDRKLRQAMQLELKNIQHELGMAFVFVTHDQEEALTMSDRIAVMDHGAIQQVGSPTEIYDRPASLFVARFVGEGNVFEGVVHRTGSTSDLALEVRTADGLSIEMRGNEAGWPHGAAAAVLIRPEDLELAPGDALAPSSYASIEADVAQTLFVGSDFQVVARTKGGQSIKATIRDSSRRLSDRLRPGTSVVLRYRLDAPRILAPEART
ncbi:MAG: ABC transporter ATP-binding protein [Gammaproteobacteria bacterium]